MSIGIFDAYVSKMALAHLSRKANEAMVPSIESITAAALFADIAGFTALTEKLAHKGPEGAEVLTRIINSYFNKIIEEITGNGGDIIYFAGDALLALWPYDGDSIPSVLRTANSGLTLQRTLHNFRTETGDQLTLRVGIAAGALSGMYIGGLENRWNFLVAGETLAQMSMAKESARVGEVNLAMTAYECIKDACVATPTESHPEVVRLESLRIVSSSALNQDTGEPLEGNELARPFVPLVVSRRIEAGLRNYLAEMRRVSTIFVNFPDWDANAEGALEGIQTRMEVAQAAVFRYGGEINKIGADDKGTTLIAVFGLPDQSHEDDPLRAVQAAMDIRGALSERGMSVSIGVTTGRAFCGVVGNNHRCEYTIMGDAVNFSARLMQKAQGEIFCDGVTYSVISAKIDSEKLPSIPIKGKSGLAEVYRPVGRAKAAKLNHVMFGRIQEQAILRESVADLKSGNSGIVVIEGEVGIGKSRLVQHLIEHAVVEGIDCLIGASDAIEKSTLYYAWRPIVSQLFSINPSAGLEERRESTIKALGFAPDLANLVPLLNPFLALELADNDLTSQMVGQVRADNTTMLVCRVLEHAVKAVSGLGQGLAVVIEDAHWLDSASWALLQAVSTRVSSVLIVMATRPIQEPVPTEYKSLLDANDSRVLSLSPLDHADAMALATERLGIDRLPEVVSEIIQARAQGNPFFTQELAYALRDAGILLIEDGRCRLADGIEDFKSLDIPDTLQGVITSRIDRLSPAQQLTIKVASVIGRVFGCRILGDVYPMKNDKEHLQTYLQSLDKLDLTNVETPPPDTSYIFKHVITQEITYGLLLSEHKKLLHSEVAEWYERSYTKDDLEQFAPLLAHHWHMAGSNSKSVDYQEIAGMQALRSGAYREAVGFFRSAIKFDHEFNLQNSNERRGAWQRQLGVAYYGLGQIEKAREHLLTAISLLGTPMPGATSVVVVKLVGQLLRQLMHRLAPKLFRPVREPRAAALKESVQAHETLMVIFYFSQETVKVVYAANRGLNLAERLPPCDALARIYANMCVSAGLAPLHSLARMYRRLARQTGEIVNEHSATAWVLYVTSVYGIGAGLWAGVRLDLEKAVDILQKLGDLRHLDEAQSLLGNTLFFQGQFLKSVAYYENAYKAGQKRGDQQAKMWGLCGKAQASLAMGEIENVIAYCDELLSYATDGTRAESIYGHGMLAKAHCIVGNYALALKSARDASRMIRGFPPTAVYAYEGYGCCAEAFVDLLELGNDAIAAPQTLLAESKRALSDLKAYARVFPIGKPRYRYVQGRLAWMMGKQRDAIALWTKSMDLAVRLAMPYEEGRARLELVRNTAAHAPRRAEHIERAAHLFEEMGTSYYRGLLGEVTRTL